MNVNELHSNSRALQAIIPAAIGANAAKTGAIIARQSYGGVEFIASYGLMTTTGTVVLSSAKKVT